MSYLPASANPAAQSLVLIAEDEAEIADILAAYLQRHGLRTLHAADGREALAMHQTCKPDLLLLDVQMPQLDGWQVLEGQLLAFTAFSGSHQDAIRKGYEYMKNSGAEYWEVPYLPINPADIHREYEPVIRINSQSGKGGAAFVLQHTVGYNLPKEMHPEFGNIVKAAADEYGDELSSEQIVQLFRKELTLPANISCCVIASPSLTKLMAVSTAVLKVKFRLQAKIRV